MTEPLKCDKRIAKTIQEKVEIGGGRVTAVESYVLAASEWQLNRTVEHLQEKLVEQLKKKDEAEPKGSLERLGTAKAFDKGMVMGKIELLKVLLVDLK